MTRRTGAFIRAGVIAVIFAALVLFARAVSWSEVWRAMRTTSVPILFAAIVVNLASLVLKGVRWWIFLRPVGVSSIGLAIRASFTGAALNNILVANSGEAARVIVVSRAASVASERVLATLALERLFELVGYIVLLALTVSVFTLPPGLSDMRPVAIGSLVGVFALLWYLVKHPATAELAALDGGGLWHRARHYGKGFLLTLAAISTGKRFAASLAISVVVWALQVATYQLTARAAHFEISIVGTIAAILAVNLGFAARATPGNVGVFQMAYAMTAAAFGMDKDQATGVAFLIQIQQIVPVTLIGLLASPEFSQAGEDAIERLHKLLRVRLCKDEWWLELDHVAAGPSRDVVHRQHVARPPWRLRVRIIAPPPTSSMRTCRESRHGRLGAYPTDPQ